MNQAEKLMKAYNSRVKYIFNNYPLIRFKMMALRSLT